MTRGWTPELVRALMEYASASDHGLGFPSKDYEGLLLLFLLANMPLRYMSLSLPTLPWRARRNIHPFKRGFTSPKWYDPRNK